MLAISSKAWLVSAVGAESRALNGSPLIILKGEGLGFGARWSGEALVGLPRRIGTMSGTASFSSTECDFEATIAGGVAARGSAGGRR